MSLPPSIFTSSIEAESALCTNLKSACQVSIIEFDNKIENYYTTTEKSVPIHVVSLFSFKIISTVSNL